MGDHDHALTGMALDDAVDGVDGPGTELVGALRSGDQTPLPRRHRLLKDRITLGPLLPEQPAFPVAEEDLAELTLDRGLQTEPLGERRRRLVRAPQAGDVDRVDVLVGQTKTELFGLPPPLRCELGIAMTVGESEGLTGLRRRRFTMAHDEQFRRARRGRESKLAEPFGFGRGGGIGRHRRSIGFSPAVP